MTAFIVLRNYDNGSCDIAVTFGSHHKTTFSEINNKLMNWTPELREQRRIQREAAYAMACVAHPKDVAREHVDRLYPEPPPELTYSQGVCGNFESFYRTYYRRSDGKWFYEVFETFVEANFLSDEIVLNLAKLVPAGNKERP